MTDSHFVVKIITKSRSTSLIEPWCADSERSCTGTGSLIQYKNNKYIITNEHVIRNHTNVHIKIDGMSLLFAANVVYSNESCDLAIIDLTESLNNSNFDKYVKFLPLNSSIPKPGDKITTHGFPQGGDSYCQTKGEASRAEAASYYYESQKLPRLQISAPINPGSSGGCVTKESDDNKSIIGITNSGMPGCQNIGYVIPSIMIKRFLDQYCRLTYSPNSFPSIHYKCQELQQDSMRNYYGLKTYPKDQGVLVVKVPELSGAYGKLKVNDVILEIDNINVRADGIINYEDVEFTASAYFALKPLFSSVKFKVLRKSNIDNNWNEETISIQIMKYYSDLNLYSNSLSCKTLYYVHPSGAVFVVPNRMFIYSYDTKVSGGGRIYRDTTARPNCLIPDLFKHKTHAKNEKVFLKTVMTTNQTLGQSAHCGVVKKVNGKEIHSLNQLAQMLEMSNDTAELILSDDTRLILKPTTKKEEETFCDKNHINKRMSPVVSEYIEKYKLRLKVNNEYIEQYEKELKIKAEANNKISSTIS